MFSFPRAGILQVKRKAGVMYETSNPQGSCGTAHSISSPDTHQKRQTYASGGNDGTNDPGPPMNGAKLNAAPNCPPRATSHTSQEPSPLIVRAQSESVQRPSQHTLHNHVGWSRILECSVKSYVTGYLNQMLFQ